MDQKVASITFMMRGAWVRRYHTEPRIQEETVGHHSHGVAAILIILYPDASTNLLKAAIVHDLEEKMTGDMPAPAKREMGVRQVFEEYGQRLRRAAGLAIPPLTEMEEVMLKFADCLHGALSSLREMEIGNRYASEPFHNFVKYMNAMRPKLGPMELGLIHWVCHQAMKCDWAEDGR
jgi:5'-deoxynucleotidase YfbR-like HD superfamily hydrolase